MRWTLYTFMLCQFCKIWMYMESYNFKRGLIYWVRTKLRDCSFEGSSWVAWQKQTTQLVSKHTSADFVYIAGSKWYHINTSSQAGFDPPAQSEVCYQSTALPPSHHGWIWPGTLLLYNILTVTFTAYCGQQMLLQQYCFT